jgi:hypothetical protein
MLAMSLEIDVAIGNLEAIAVQQGAAQHTKLRILGCS